MEKKFDQMNTLQIYLSKELQSRFRKRAGETKLGETVQRVTDAANWFGELQKSDAHFVLLGLPEDIGIRANQGRGGAWSAWEPALSALLNMQSNDWLHGKEMLVLGHIDFSDWMKATDALDLKSESGLQRAREITAEVDKRVFPVIEKIIAAGKIPIIIGGGHNNSYPIIRAAAEKLGAMNIVNLDAHSDLRPAEGRHSGNGFRYAWDENYLAQYAIVGLQENYAGKQSLDFMRANSKQIRAFTFEDLFIYRPQTDLIGTILNELKAFLDSTKSCGLEIDLDLIQNTPSSAKTSSGISANQARQFVYQVARQFHPKYLHLAEAAPVLSHIKADNKTGKLLAYLISDFVKGCSE
jgi:formiminoglutamase